MNSIPSVSGKDKKIWVLYRGYADDELIKHFYLLITKKSCIQVKQIIGNLDKSNKGADIMGKLS